MTTKDLIPINKRSKQEAYEISRKGGLASGKARRQKRDLKEVARVILNEAVSDKGEAKELLKNIPSLDEDLSNGALLLFSIFKQAMSADTKLIEKIKAFELLRDTSGQKVTKQDYPNLDEDGYIRVLVDGVDIFEEDYGSAYKD